MLDISDSVNVRANWKRDGVVKLINMAKDKQFLVQVCCQFALAYPT